MGAPNDKCPFASTVGSTALFGMLKRVVPLKRGAVERIPPELKPSRLEECEKSRRIP